MQLRDGSCRRLRCERPHQNVNRTAIKTLAHVRVLMRHLPKECPERSTWRLAADDLTAAVRGAYPAEAATALRLVLMLEHVECRPV